LILACLQDLSQARVRSTKVQSIRSAASGNKYSAWSYDPQGQLTAAANSAGTVGYAYDFAGDNTCVAYPISTNTNCANIASLTNTVVKYGYDADGRMMSMADWLTNSFNFGYDIRSNLTSIQYPASTTWTETFGPYDPANNFPTLKLTSPTYGTSTASYTYNADELFSNEVGTAYTYNAKLQLNGAGTHGYGYQPSGAINSESAPGLSTVFNVNGDSELTSKVTNGSTTSYAYDANGNRCAAAAGTTTPSCSSSTAIAGVYGYNAFKQLCYSGTQITGVGSCAAPPSGATKYFYDGEGLRTSDTATTLGTSQNFVYDTQTRSGQPLIIEDGTNAYLYGPGNFGAGTAPIEEIPLGVGVVTYPVNSPMGVFALFSVAGLTVGTASYTTYGTRTTTGTTTPFGFQGGYTDSSGLLYLINRYYDPSTDQFLSVDPDVAKTGQPYAFSSDDPINMSDPNGLQPTHVPVTYATIVAAYCAGVTRQVKRGNFSGASLLATGVLYKTGISCPVGHPRGTVHVCIGATISILFGGTASVCVVAGNGKIGTTETAGRVTGLYGGGGVSIGGSDAHNIKQLSGPFKTGGGGIVFGGSGEAGNGVHSGSAGVYGPGYGFYSGTTYTSTQSTG